MAEQSWSYNGVNLNTKAWSVIEVSEGLGTPSHRGGNLQVPFMHGKRYIKKRYDERIVMLPMWVRGLDPITGNLPSGHSLNSALYDNIDYLTSLLGMSGQHVLRRTLPDGSTREAVAEVYRPISFVKQQDGYAKFAAEFLLVDPFFYSTIKSQDLRTISAGTFSWTLGNSGTAQVTSATITLTGPLDSPKLENLNTGVFLQYQGSIGLGESVVINTKDFTCTKDGTNMISAIRHGGDAYWLIIEVGNNSMKMTTGVTGGSCRIEYYPPYF